jgi:hypothetical protein
MDTNQINDIEVRDLFELNIIAEAKKLLRDAGYYVDNLWHIDDVKEHYNCDDTEAQEVLDGALTNDATMEQIWNAIDVYAEEYNMDLKRI